MTKKELIDLISQFPDDTEICSESEMNIKTIRFYPGMNKIELVSDDKPALSIVK